MRSVLSMIFCLLFLSSEAQFLNPNTDWFEAASFFNVKTLTNKNISDVHVMIRNKNDGEVIIDRGTFLHYEFGTNGNLKRFLKSIKLAQSTDTAIVEFYYNYENQIVKRSEKQGAFHYTFIYKYLNQLPTLAIKIDENSSSKDTLYKRTLKSEKQSNRLIIETLNEKGVPYKVKEIRYQKDTLITERTTYLRNQNYSEKRFDYEEGKLKSYTSSSFFHKKQSSVWEYEYENEVLISAMLYEDGVKAKKRAFTFRNDGLIDAVIERNYLEKSIRIYNFLYRFRE